MHPAWRVNLGSGNEPLKGYVNLDLRNVPGIQLQADVERLPLASDSIVSIRASSVLEHFADPYAVLAEIHRVLAPGGEFVMRVPAPWSHTAILDRSHVFLADIKLWKSILSGYFEKISLSSSGVQYRDHKLLTALEYAAIHLLRFHDFAETWQFTCSSKRASTSRAYVPWWLETKYGVKRP